MGLQGLRYLFLSAEMIDEESCCLEVMGEVQCQFFIGEGAFPVAIREHLLSRLLDKVGYGAGYVIFLYAIIDLGEKAYELYLTVLHCLIDGMGEDVAHEVVALMDVSDSGTGGVELRIEGVGGVTYDGFAIAIVTLCLVIVSFCIYVQIHK